MNAGTTLGCQIHHCGHPHEEEGAHQPPDSLLNISLGMASINCKALKTNDTYIFFTREDETNSNFKKSKKSGEWMSSESHKALPI